MRHFCLEMSCKVWVRPWNLLTYTSDKLPHSVALLKHLSQQEVRTRISPDENASRKQWSQDHITSIHPENTPIEQTLEKITQIQSFQRRTAHLGLQRADSGESYSSCQWGIYIWKNDGFPERGTHAFLPNLDQERDHIWFCFYLRVFFIKNSRSPCDIRNVNALSITLQETRFENTYKGEYLCLCNSRTSLENNLFF